MNNVNWIMLFFLLFLNVIIFYQAIDYIFNLLVSKFNQTDGRIENLGLEALKSS